MKQNFPVTQTERTFARNERIVSTTDLKGRITYANASFQRIAGFTQAELTGQAHNIVRHPDMPPAAFQNLWDTLKTHTPWMGVVKNRCKNGDYYWVNAYATPIYDHGKVTGYQSVRFVPEADDLNRAQALYRRLNRGRPAVSLLGRTGPQLRLFLGILLSQTLPLAYCYSASLIDAMTSASLIALATVSSGLISWASGLRLRRLAAGTRSISNNPVANLVYSGHNDDLGQIETALKTRQAQLRTVLGRVEDACLALKASASATYASSVATLDSARTEQSEVDQVVSAVSEMAATIQEVARNTSITAESAHQAQNLVHAGKQIVSDTARTINRLSQEVAGASAAIAALQHRSNDIGTVIDVIRSIAEQTNLLALNAAIEAARAGEHGRGFAVVADEVRSLATRTQQSTGEIHAIIQNLQSEADSAVAVMQRSQDIAQESVEQTGRAVTALDNINQEVDTISSMAIQIATAAEEQSAVADEINRNIANISQLADATLAKAQESADNTQQVNTLAEELENMVGQFRED